MRSYPTYNEWNRTEILVTKHRDIILYQDGQIVTIGELDNEVPIATAGGRPGFFALSTGGSHEVLFTSGRLYDDNWSMIVWPP